MEMAAHTRAGGWWHPPGQATGHLCLSIQLVRNRDLPPLLLQIPLNNPPTKQPNLTEGKRKRKKIIKKKPLFQLPSWAALCLFSAAFFLFSVLLSAPSRQGQICILMQRCEAVQTTCEEEAELGKGTPMDACPLPSKSCQLPKNLIFPLKNDTLLKKEK